MFSFYLSERLAPCCGLLTLHATLKGLLFLTYLPRYWLDSASNTMLRMASVRTSQSPSASMEDIYADLDNKTPCIFILSTGADPTSMLLRFAKVGSTLPMS